MNVVEDKKSLSNALLFATQYGHLETVQRLLETNVNTDSDPFEKTVSQIVTQYSHLEIVQRFIKTGADINDFSGPNKETALQVAVQQGHRDYSKSSRS
jgi:ankyrin repeat protein